MIGAQVTSLYTQGFSTRQVSRLLHITRASVNYWTKKKNIARVGAGILIEDRLQAWLIKNGHNVERQKKSAPFDLLVDMKKVDVKSARLRYDKANKRYTYAFQLQDKTERKTDKDFNLVDFFYLVFINEKSLIFKVPTNVIQAKYLLRIPSNLKSKYPLQFVGYLD